MVNEILRAQPHYINGKKVDCKIAIPKNKLNNENSKKSKKKSDEVIVYSGNYYTLLNPELPKARLVSIKETFPLNGDSKGNTISKSSFIYLVAFA